MNAFAPRLAWQYARRRPARAIATILGVMAGVAGLRAIDLGTEGAVSSVRSAYREAAGPAALTVTPAGDTQAPLPPGTLAKLEGAPGVEAVLPLLQDATVRTEELNPWAAPLLPGEVSGVLVIGVDFAREEDRGRWRVVEGGEGDGVLVGSEWAAARGLAPGATVRVVAGDGEARWRIAGLLAREGLAARNYGQVIIVPIDDARRAFGHASDEANEAALVLAPGADPDEVSRSLSARLGRGAAVVRPEERGKDVAQRLGNIRAGTDLTSSIALFLSAFLIYGLYATAAAERRRDMAMLRCVGATRTQAALPLVVEAGLLAVPGAIVGALLGALLAQGVSATLSKVAGAELRVPPPDVTGAVWTAALGVAVALASALWPAIRAARQAPFEGVRAIASAAEPPRRRVTLAWLALAAVAVALLTVEPPRASNPARTYALVLLLLASCTGVLPAVVERIGALAAAPIARSFGGAAGLGVAAARWRPSRTGLAAGAVLGCVAMVGGIAALGTGMTQEMSSWADRALGWDFYVRRPSGLDAAAIARVKSAPGVLRASAATIRPAEIVRSDGRRLNLSLVGIDADAYADDGVFVFAAGTPGDHAALARSLAGGNVAFATGVVAQQFGLVAGTDVVVETPSGPRPLRIAAEVVDYTQNGFALVVDRALLVKGFGVSTADLVAVRVAPEARIEEVIAAVQLPGAKVERRLELKARVMRLVDESMAAMDGLLWLCALIGLLAVGASVAQGAIERRKDIAALRALGMTRRQVAVMLGAEAVATAAVGALGGAALGIYLGWVFAESTHTLGIPLPYVPPWRALGFSALAVVVAALPAAWLPARRSAEVSPLEALRGEG